MLARSDFPLQQICDIMDGNDPGLTANVRLLREPMRGKVPKSPPHAAAAQTAALLAATPVGAGSAGPPSWDPYCAKRGTNIGAFVKSAASRTTAKRGTTLADHN